MVEQYINTETIKPKKYGFEPTYLPIQGKVKKCLLAVIS